MGVALVTKHVVNACHWSAILVVYFIVGGVAVLIGEARNETEHFSVKR